ncbi:MAG: glycosyl transferase [Syntrophus sp. (in: bacteria)]|nr:glycosyl transferase [Syntrophus sp. (in: bacteria)]
MKTRKTLSVVVPVYFNEGSLPLLFEALKAVEGQLDERGVRLELILVDDGSGDGSFNEMMKIKAQRQATKVIRLTRNFGSMRAVKVGCQFVTGDAFIFLSADLQDPPVLIPEMVDRWLNGAKYVVCKREGRDDPWSSKLFSYLYYMLIRLLVVKDYPRGGFDMALMDSAMLKHIQVSSKNLFTPLLGFWLGYKPEFISYRRMKRVHGKSRWTFFKKFNAFLDAVLGFSVTPLRCFSLIGAIVSLASFSYGAWIVFHALFVKKDVPGFATLAVLISFLLGLVIILLSIIGEYLWRIYDEVNKRPEAVIDEVYE